jgi:hypothetical protein
MMSPKLFLFGLSTIVVKTENGMYSGVKNEVWLASRQVYNATPQPNLKGVL